MARPKKGAKKVQQASVKRAVIIHLKGSDEYAKWLERVHKKTLIPKAAIMRDALKDWAKKNGHEAPPATG